MNVLYKRIFDAEFARIKKEIEAQYNDPNHNGARILLSSSYRPYATRFMMRISELYPINTIDYDNVIGSINITFNK